MRAPSAHDFAIIMAYDAFRICIGGKPKNAPKDVLRWMRLMLKPALPAVPDGAKK